MRLISTQNTPSEELVGETSQGKGKSRLKIWMLMCGTASVILVPLGLYWMFLTCDPLGVGFTCLAEYPFGTFIGGSTHEYTALNVDEFRDDFPVFAFLKGRELQLNHLREEELLRLFPELKGSSHWYEVDHVHLNFEDGRLTSVNFYESSVRLYETEFKIGNERAKLPLSSREMRKRFGPPIRTDWHRSPVRWG